MKSTFQVLPLSALIGSATLLTGCSSSSNNTTTNLGGNASDGYIVGATVFLDLNNNLTRDANEPQTTTGAKGLYNLDLTGLTPAQIAAGKIVLTGGIDDSTDAPFTSILTAKTDGNSTSAAITPITSLITALVEAGTPLATAKTQIATALGVPANLVDQDPIAHAATNPDLLKQAVALQKAMEVLAKAEANGGDEKEAMQRIAKAIAKQAAATNAGTTATNLIDTAVTNQGTEFTQAAKVTNVKELAKSAAQRIENVLASAEINGGLSETSLNSTIKEVQSEIDNAKNAADKATDEPPYQLGDKYTAEQKLLLLAMVNKTEGKIKSLSPDNYRVVIQNLIYESATWLVDYYSLASSLKITPYQLLTNIVEDQKFNDITLSATSPTLLAQIQTIAQSLVPPPAFAATGKAADGYLVGAKVCLDKNKNGKCDTDEPNTITTIGGAYSLTGVTQNDMDTYPTVVEVTSSTIDTDNNQAVGGSYTLSARAGQNGFISPITTMVNNAVAANPALKAEEALAQIRSRMGVVDSGLLDSVDYVAAKTTGSNENQQLYAGAHAVAQGVAAVLKDTNATINSVGDNSRYASMVITEFVSSNLGAIAEDIKNSKNNTINGIASTVNGSQSVITNKITQKIDTSSASLPTTDAILSLMKNGLYWIENSNTWKGMGVSYATPASTAQSGTMVSKETSLTCSNDCTTWSTTWNAPTEGDEIILDASNNWVKSDSTVKPTTFTIDNDGTFNLSSRYYETQTARGAVIDLAGKSIAEKVNAYTGWTMSNNSSSFQNGAQAVVFNRINKTEGWTIHNSEPNNGTCNNNQITAVNGNCNVIQIPKQGGGMENATSLNNLANNTVGINGNSVVRFNSDASRATYYTNWNWQTSQGIEVADVAVIAITKGSTSFIAIPYPASLRDKQEEDMTIFAMVDGVVRMGRHRAKDDVATMIMFNKTAAENVLSAAGLPAMPSW